MKGMDIDDVDGVDGVDGVDIYGERVGDGWMTSHYNVHIIIVIVIWICF